MSQTINTLLAQPFQVTANIVLNRNDMDGAVSARTISDLGYYRVWVAAGGSGTEDAPYEILAKLQAALGARYTVRLTTTGLVRISYSGTGSAILTWTGGGNTAGPLRSLLGFSGSTTTIVGGSYTDSDYQPHGCIFNASVRDSSGIVTDNSGGSFSHTAGGLVYGHHSGTATVEKRFILGFHPRSWADRSVTGAIGTPVYPESITSIITPRTLYGASTSGSWSVHEFISTAAGQKLGLLFYTYQNKIASAISGSDYWVGNLTEETILGINGERQPIANYPRVMDRPLGLYLLSGAL